MRGTSSRTSCFHLFSPVSEFSSADLSVFSLDVGVRFNTSSLNVRKSRVWTRLVTFPIKMMFVISFKHETADGGVQAIRIKRYTESVFLPVRKLGGVGANKGKVRMT